MCPALQNSLVLTSNSWQIRSSRGFCFPTKEVFFFSNNSPKQAPQEEHWKGSHEQPTHMILLFKDTRGRSPWPMSVRVPVLPSCQWGCLYSPRATLLRKRALPLPPRPGDHVLTMALERGQNLFPSSPFRSTAQLLLCGWGRVTRINLLATDFLCEVLGSSKPSSHTWRTEYDFQLILKENSLKFDLFTLSLLFMPFICLWEVITNFLLQKWFHSKLRKNQNLLMCHIIWPKKCGHILLQSL